MVDRYAKTVLTVIAACLVWIVARDLEVVGIAQAQSEKVDVNIVEISGKRIGRGGIPVEVKNFFIDVNCLNCK